jgi:drug/metabolite transporter superfamily protein YnfA
LRTFAVFLCAALLEIAGCFAFWAWLRQNRAPWIAVLGVASLIGFAAVLTRAETAFAGRAYAAYGSVYIVRRSDGYGPSKEDSRIDGISRARRCVWSAAQ